MPPNIRILDIDPGSDGDGRKWPKHHYVRNDEYFKERIATDKWINDLPGGPQPGVTYRLNKLPQGYAGFERQRPDSKHVDRYIYGHPNGQFRSLNEFYPHFKHLMDHGGPAGCPCKLCAGGTKKTASGSKVKDSSVSEASGSPPRQSRYFADSAQAGQAATFPQEQLISPFRARGRPPKNSSEEESPLEKRKLVDYEGTPDVYEALIEKLNKAGPEGGIDEPIEEKMSPDWRVGNGMSRTLLQEWQKLPPYVPRTGELVLFVRKLGDGIAICWDKSTQTFRRAHFTSKTWLESPTWEAGVVTKMPEEQVREQDLVSDQGKKQAVNYSGFRIQPLSEPGNESKPYIMQHRHVPLRAIRPFALWGECLNGVPEKDWHPTIKHALTVASSFCILGRYRFKGVWPNATVFSRGVYIGSELILVGDTVRLLPRRVEQHDDKVTDVMVVTAIRLRFVNLGFEDGDWAPDPPELPYQTCLHISGRVYTRDPTRSFDGVGKVPTDPRSNILPTGITEYGPWYHYTDPKKPSATVELPYSRIFGRCFGEMAMHAWFETAPNVPSSMPPFLSFQAVKSRAMLVTPHECDISRGLQGITEARQYGMQNDKRIKSSEGTSWFWADTRIEQLDLIEVNDRFVGSKHAMRTNTQMAGWRKFLKALDGKKGGLEAYHADRRERRREEEAKMERVAASSGTSGLVKGSMLAGMESATDAERVEDEDAMELDGESEAQQDLSAMDDAVTPQKATPRKVVVALDDTDSEDEDEEEQATNQLVGELAKNIRPNDSRLR